MCAKASVKLKQVEQANRDAMFVFLSDIWLDQVKVSFSTDGLDFHYVIHLLSVCINFNKLILVDLLTVMFCVFVVFR